RVKKAEKALRLFYFEKKEKLNFKNKQDNMIECDFFFEQKVRASPFFSPIHCSCLDSHGVFILRMENKTFSAFE
ncbi:hypothetical protein, partial [Xylanibacter rodentium]|uniref:hypothetical protein n=1 Tax=Xylanibacter rodentium TaxID=2736289 RepID=UPI002588D5E2